MASYGRSFVRQGIWLKGIGTLNIEVTVTEQRGWVNEPTRQFAGDVKIQPRIWLSPSANDSPFIKLLWALFENCSLPFPSTKPNAMLVNACNPSDNSQTTLQGRIGQSPLFQAPSFAQHPGTWAVGNLAVQIASIVSTHNPLVDEFNQLVMDAFNLGGGNILQAGNVLAWNLWFNTPNLVDRDEWRTHAERWRDAIEEEYVGPTGPGSPIRYYDGSLFQADEAAVDEAVQAIVEWVKEHFLKSCSLQ